MSDSVTTVVYGLGTIGKRLCQETLVDDDYDLVAAVDIDPEYVGEDLGDILNIQETDVVVTDSHEELHEQEDVDLSIVTTTSFWDGVMPVVRDCVRSGTDVLSTSEELFYPRPEHRDEAAELNELAQNHGVTVLSQGMNPGFIFDVLPAMVSGVCIDVNHIRVVRHADSTQYETSRSRFGFGLPVEEYRTRLSAGEVQTHAGMHESLHMLGDALGIEYDSIEELQEPVIASNDIETPYVEVPAGTVCGLHQKAFGIIDDVVFISVEARLGLYEAKGQKDAMKDTVSISGDPSFDVTIEPSIKSLEGTVGRTLNSIPVILDAAPGYTNLKDLPLGGSTVGGIDAVRQK